MVDEPAPLVSDLMATPGEAMLESDFLSQCVKCGTDGGLDSCKSQMEEIERAYCCPECDNLMVVVGPLGAPGKLGGKGHRFGDWRIDTIAPLYAIVQGEKVSLGTVINRPRS